MLWSVGAWGWRWVGRFVLRFVFAGQAVAEGADSFAQLTGRLGDAPGTKQQQDHHQDDQQFGNAYVHDFNGTADALKRREQESSYYISRSMPRVFSSRAIQVMTGKAALRMIHSETATEPARIQKPPAPRAVNISPTDSDVVMA